MNSALLNCKSVNPFNFISFCKYIDLLSFYFCILIIHVWIKTLQFTTNVVCCSLIQLLILPKTSAHVCVCLSFLLLFNELKYKVQEKITAQGVRCYDDMPVHDKALSMSIKSKSL